MSLASGGAVQTHGVESVIASADLSCGIMKNSGYLPDPEDSHRVYAAEHGLDAVVGHLDIDRRDTRNDEVASVGWRPAGPGARCHLGILSTLETARGERAAGPGTGWRPGYEGG